MTTLTEDRIDHIFETATSVLRIVSDSGDTNEILWLEEEAEYWHNEFGDLEGPYATLDDATKAAGLTSFPPPDIAIFTDLDEGELLAMLDTDTCEPGAIYQINDTWWEYTEDGIEPYDGRPPRPIWWQPEAGPPGEEWHILARSASGLYFAEHRESRFLGWFRGEER